MMMMMMMMMIGADDGENEPTANECNHEVKLWMGICVLNFLEFEMSLWG
jgi:hypothetical protein